ncbi:hypothetical protein C5167_003635 [Papaver somniferum]|uniref:Uncharacterized protein n=1 Tax=Papaver somniferum TaxID=3469 RepID=A0A4Y7L3A4_PAPSO|nr:hypothetical protein C5167_003635 [Papaver somniferum]
MEFVFGLESRTTEFPAGEKLTEQKGKSLTVHLYNLESGDGCYYGIHTIH